MLMLFLTHQTGYCDSPSVQVELTSFKSEISFGEYEVPINIKITNSENDVFQFLDSKVDFLPSGKSPENGDFLITDDPGFELNLHEFVSGYSMVTLKPGESLNKAYVYEN